MSDIKDKKGSDIDKSVNNPVKELYEEKAEKSKENLAKGGSAVNISLTNKVKIKFTEDSGFNKKGTIQEISEVAYEIYSKKGVVKKL